MRLLDREILPLLQTTWTDFLVKNTIFRGKNFRGLLTFAAPKDAMPPNFVEKTFADSHKSVKFAKVFSLESFLLYDIINLITGLSASRISQFFLHQYILFYLAQLFICRNSQYLFPKHWNWQICHTNWVFKLPFHTLNNGKLRTFPTVKSKTNTGFLLDSTQQ